MIFILKILPLLRPAKLDYSLQYLQHDVQLIWFGLPVAGITVYCKSPIDIDILRQITVLVLERAKVPDIILYIQVLELF